ncbi:hypothetical protein [Polaromonas sp.]|uniref:hypothetical protein n=1 Tax=Polaromonas sp. TaxID=1869339 RepID=UPI00352B8D86
MHENRDHPNVSFNGFHIEGGIDLVVEQDVAQDAIAHANSQRANGRRGKTISQERHSPQGLLKT